VLADVPIIMLTAKGEEADIVKGLNVGADDVDGGPKVRRGGFVAAV